MAEEGEGAELSDVRDDLGGPRWSIEVKRGHDLGRDDMDNLPSILNSAAVIALVIAFLIHLVGH